MLFQHFFQPTSLLFFQQALFFHTVLSSYFCYYCTLSCLIPCMFSCLPACWLTSPVLACFLTTVGILSGVVAICTLRAQMHSCSFAFFAYFLDYFLANFLHTSLRSSVVLFFHVFWPLSLLFSSTSLPSSLLLFFRRFFPSSCNPLCLLPSELPLTFFYTLLPTTLQLFLPPLFDKFLVCFLAQVLDQFRASFLHTFLPSSQLFFTWFIAWFLVFLHAYFLAIFIAYFLFQFFTPFSYFIAQIPARYLVYRFPS